MNVPAHICKRLVKVLSRTDDPEAVEIVAALGPKARRPRRSLAPGKPRADPENARVERLIRLADIRLALHGETGGTCAVCGLPLPFGLMHAHHILSGPERRSQERQETMAPCHERCHDALHGKNPKMDQRDALVLLLAWCEVTARVQAEASTRRRIAKIDEARELSAPRRTAP